MINLAYEKRRRQVSKSVRYSFLSQVKLQGSDNYFGTCSTPCIIHRGVDRSITRIAALFLQLVGVGQFGNIAKTNFRCQM